MECGGDIAHKYLQEIEVDFTKCARLGTFDVTSADHAIAPDQGDRQRGTRIRGAGKIKWMIERLFAIIGNAVVGDIAGDAVIVR